MIKIAICDDSIRFTGFIEEKLLQLAHLHNLVLDIDVFFDGAELIRATSDGNVYDLIYLDIEMQQKNGIETARQIRRSDRTVPLIYISGYDKYLKELFEVEPFRFLSKPVNETLFDRYFMDAYERITENNVYFHYMFNKELRKVNVRNVIYFESRNRVVHIILSNGNEECFYGKINDVEKELLSKNQPFLRIHQSYLVNYNYVLRMNFSSLVLEHGKTEITLQISEGRQKKVRAVLFEIAQKQSGMT